MRDKLPLAAATALSFLFIGAGNTVTQVPVTWETPKKQNLYSGLFANYTASPTSVSFLVCGSLPDTEGCYTGGAMEPFEQACAVIEGTPKINKDNVMTRAIYVLDKRTSKTAPITLYVYKRTDTLSNSFDNVQVTLEQSVPLGLTGGTKSHCSLAADSGFVFAATSADTSVAMVDKSTFAVTQEGGFDPPENVVSITSDDRGYVALHFTDGFNVFDPSGNEIAGGGGVADMVNTRNGWIPQ